uniref:T9SS type B sorting domain-containing protein n=1 Tax=Myroides odoratus TaxID=256 RepID=UPI000765D09A
MKKKIIGVLLTLFFIPLVYCQKYSIVVNEGELVISPNDLVSFEGSFENKESAYVINDGTVIYLQDFINNGYYGITSNRKSSKTIFATNTNNRVKQIKGNRLVSLLNVEFSSIDVPNTFFEIKNNLDVYGIADFREGIVKIDSIINPDTNVSYGMITFQQGSDAINSNDYSYVEGEVEKIGNEQFKYPIGDNGTYRYARISAPKGKEDVFLAKYIYNDNSFFNSHFNTVGVVKLINTREYWLISKSDKNQSDILLTLSWNEKTTLPDLLNNPEEELHIVRWDDIQKIWVDEGGVVDMSHKEVTTIANVKGYGYFTLATVKKDWVLDGDIVIYNLVTPDGDGKNDYFIIDNIKNYPNNKVEIFNR